MIRFGIVGCGKIGGRHAERIDQNPEGELVAVCDVIHERADSYAERYDCSAFYELTELLKSDVDVVSICTPSGLHGAMSVAALRSGKHVLCEKPMTTSLEDADRVVSTESDCDRRYFLVKQNRYNPPVKALKDAVYHNRLGAISYINCTVLWNRAERYYAEDDWRGTMALDGGALMTQCSHFLDLMLWIGGKVRSVGAVMRNLNHSRIETEDTGLVTITFASGAIGSLQYTMNVYRENLEGSMTVLGSAGSIKVGGQYLNILERWDVDGVDAPVLEKCAGPNDYGTYRGSMSNHDKVIDNVIKTLRGKAHVAVNSQQGRESVEVMQAAYISAINGREVRLPLSGPDYHFRIGEQLPLSGHRKVTL